MRCVSILSRGKLKIEENIRLPDTEIVLFVRVWKLAANSCTRFTFVKTISES